MAVAPVQIVLKSRLGAIALAAEKKAETVVGKTALDIEAGCKERSRVDFGVMKAGWTAEQQGLLEWIVYNPVEYTIYNEYPTDRRPAQPMLAPSVEEARGPFEEAMAQLYVPGTGT